MSATIFWLCAIGSTYSYLWYPLILLLFSRRNTPPCHPQDGSAPTHLAIVIAARNEARHIEAKLDNCLALQRAGLTIDIIVASDASNDATDEITKRYAVHGVRLVRSDVRRGKEYVQGLAAAGTRAEVVIFTDASVRLATDVLNQVVSAFRDPSVGAVSSVDQLIAADGALQGEGAYVRYEMWLRNLETRFYSLVGLSGSFFIARKAVCIDWDSRVPSDFGVALNCVRAGLRAVLDRSIVGHYRALAAPQLEYRRKLRTVNRGMNGLLLRRHILNIRKFPRFAFEVISHKIMRWAVPWFLLGTLATGALMAPYSWVYASFLGIELTLFVVPLGTMAAPFLRRFSVIRLAAFFVETNLAILHASILTILGRRITFWEPSQR